jgi:hypothetical protein
LGTTLKSELLSVQEGELASLRAFIENEDLLPNELQNHFSVDEANEVEISDYRFTRILKLYKHLASLALSPRYERFFGDYAEEWKQAQRDFQSFCNRSVTALELVVKYRAENAVAAHKELLEETRDNFRVYCHNVFSQLALLLAGALVSSEQDEEHIDAALRKIGFRSDSKYEMGIEFPVDELCFLGIILCIYVLAAYLFLIPNLLGPPATAPSLPPVVWPICILFSYITAVTVTIKLLLSRPRVLTKPGRPWGKYIVCAAAAAVSVAVVVWSPLVVSLYHWHGGNRPHWKLLLRMPLAAGAMCLVVAYFCETDLGDRRGSTFRRLGEALGVGCAIAAAELVLSSKALLGPLPENGQSLALLGLGPRTLLLLIGLPFSLAAIIGFFLPDMYRMNRSVAQSSQTSEEGIAQRYEPRAANRQQRVE